MCFPSATLWHADNSQLKHNLSWFLLIHTHPPEQPVTPLTIFDFSSFCDDMFMKELLWFLLHFSPCFGIHFLFLCQLSHALPGIPSNLLIHKFYCLGSGFGNLRTLILLFFNFQMLPNLIDWPLSNVMNPCNFFNWEFSMKESQNMQFNCLWSIWCHGSWLNCFDTLKWQERTKYYQLHLIQHDLLPYL